MVVGIGVGSTAMVMIPSPVIFGLGPSLETSGSRRARSLRSRMDRRASFLEIFCRFGGGG